MAVVKLKRKGNNKRQVRGEIEFDGAWPQSDTWVQVLRKPGKHAVVSLDGYLSMDFDEDYELCHKR
jgi:hypothetical protein